MTIVAALLSGALLGLAVAAPIGPMGVLCIQRTLAFGAGAGVATGLGAATVHVVLGGAATLGAAAAAKAWLLANAQALALASAALLVWLAVRVLRRRVAIGPATPPAGGPWRAYASAVAFGLSNPLTFVLLAAAAPALAIQESAGPLPVVAGIFLGSAGWWVALSLGVAAVRGRLSLRMLGRINTAAGLVLLGFGLAIGLRSWQEPAGPKFPSPVVAAPHKVG